MLAANQRALYRAGLIATFDSDCRWVLPLIDLPTLILVGEEDQATPIGYAEYLQTNIRGSPGHPSGGPSFQLEKSRRI